MRHAQTQSAFAAALFDPNTAPAGVTTARGAPDPARFAIYRNNVFVALIKPLEARFPVVRQLVGDEFFRGMARDFVGASKPASPLIMDYGDDFAQFVRNYQPARGVPYLADVAELEAAWTRAYHAADAAPLELSSLAAIAVENLLATPMNAHPAATLISSPFPIGSIWATHQADNVSPVADWKPETVLIVRPAYDVVVHVVPAGDAEFASALLDGIAPGAAAEMTLLHNRDFDFGAALTGLISLGAFAAHPCGRVFAFGIWGTLLDATPPPRTPPRKGEGNRISLQSPPHPASTSLGHPLPAGERRLEISRPSLLPSGEKVVAKQPDEGAFELIGDSPALADRDSR